MTGKNNTILLLLLFLYTTLHAQPGKDVKATVYIAGFKAVSKDTSYRTLGAEVPSVLSVGLMRYQKIECRKLKDTLDIPNAAGYLVTGTYTLYQDELYINTLLKDIRANTYYDLSVVHGKTAAVGSLFDELSASVYNAIAEIEDDKSLQRLVVSCFVKENKGDTVKPEDVTFSMLSALYGQKGVTVVSQSEVSKYCGFIKDHRRLLRDSHSDFLITGRYVSSRDGITVHPVVYTRDSSNAIVLPAASGRTINDATALIALELDECIRFFSGMGIKKYPAIFNYSSADYNDYITKARVLIRDTVYFPATFLLEKAIEMRPELPDAYFEIGHIREMQYRYAEAATYYSKSLERNLSPGQGYTALGNLMLTTGDYDKALVAFKKLEQSGTDNMNARYYTGLAYLMLGMNDSAKIKMNEIVAVDPVNINANILLGEIEQDAGRYKEALSFYFKALQSDSLNKDVRVRISNAMLVQADLAEKGKDISNAKKLYRESLRYYPDQYGYELLRKFYVRTGLIGEAGQLIQKGINENVYPSKHDIYLAHAQELRSFKQNGEFNKSYLTEALSYLHSMDDPSDTVLRYIGSTYFRLQKYDSAAACYRGVIRINPSDVTAWYDLLEILVMSNAYDQAQSVLDTMNIMVSRGELSLDNRALWYYFSGICKICNPAKYPGLSESDDMEYLKKLFSKGQPVQRWDYTSFKGWVKNSGLSSDQKKRVTDLTGYMEKNTESL